MAASLSVQMLGVQEWDYVLDMCAAPWGKSVQIADALMSSWTKWRILGDTQDSSAIASEWQNVGFLISNEIDQWRKKALESNLHRCGIFNLWVINQDWCVIWDEFPETFDKVLVDAPCSWEWMQYKSDKKVRQRDEKKSKKLSDLQIQLLISWLKSLKVWGELVYSTCTTNILENEYVVSEVLKEYWDKVELLEIPLKEKSDWITTRRWNEILSPENAKKVARLWPHVQKTWGFFIAKFRKVGAMETTPSSLRDTPPNRGENSKQHFCSLLGELDCEAGLRGCENNLFSSRWISPISDLDFFVSKYTVNIAPKPLIQLYFESKIPNIEIWLPIFKIVKDNKNQTEKLIPLVWIAQTFGHLATKNVLEITDEQLKLLMEKRDLIDDILADYEWKFVILKWNWVGVWLVSVQKWIWKNKCF